MDFSPRATRTVLQHPIHTYPSSFFSSFSLPPFLLHFSSSPSPFFAPSSSWRKKHPQMTATTIGIICHFGTFRKKYTTTKHGSPKIQIIQPLSAVFLHNPLSCLRTYYERSAQRTTTPFTTIFCHPPSLPPILLEIMLETATFSFLFPRFVCSVPPFLSPSPSSYVQYSSMHPVNFVYRHLATLLIYCTVQCSTLGKLIWCHSLANMLFTTNIYWSKNLYQ